MGDFFKITVASKRMGDVVLCQENRCQSHDDDTASSYTLLVDDSRYQLVQADKNVWKFYSPGNGLFRFFSFYAENVEGVLVSDVDQDGDMDVVVIGAYQVITLENQRFHTEEISLGGYLCPEQTFARSSWKHMLLDPNTNPHYLLEFALLVPAEEDRDLALFELATKNDIRMAVRLHAADNISSNMLRDHAYYSIASHKFVGPPTGVFLQERAAFSIDDENVRNFAYYQLTQGIDGHPGCTQWAVTHIITDEDLRNRAYFNVVAADVDFHSVFMSAERITDSNLRDEAYLFRMRQPLRSYSFKRWGVANRIVDGEKRKEAYRILLAQESSDLDLRFLRERLEHPELDKKLYEDVALDENEHPENRCVAASYLQNSDTAQSVFLKIASDSRIYARSRLEAAKFIRDSKVRDSIYTNIVADNNLRWERNSGETHDPRVVAAILIGDLAKRQSAYFAIAGNRNAPFFSRLLSARRVRDEKKREELLLALAEDAATPAEIRVEALERLPLSRRAEIVKLCSDIMGKVRTVDNLWIQEYIPIRISNLLRKITEL